MAFAARLSTVCIALVLFVSGCDKHENPSNDAPRLPSNNQEFDALFARAAERLTPLVQTVENTPSQLTPQETAKVRSCIADLKVCVNISSNHWQSMALLAKAHQSLGDHRSSMEWLAGAMKIETTNPILAKEASIAALHLREIDIALRFSAEAIRRRPNDPALLGNHAMNLLIARRDKQAMETIVGALAIAPDDAFNQQISKVIYQVIAGQRARPTCESALQ